MNTKTKNILLIVLGVAVIGMTVAFAALSSQLKIEGTASVPNTSWNIHFQEWDDNTNETVTYGGNEHANTAVYPSAESLTKTLSPNITKVEGLNVTLYQPGDYASYTFQIINEVSIDESLDSFDKNLTCASGNDCSHLSYTIECVDSQNNNVLTGNPTLAAGGGLAYCTLTVTYTDQTNNNTAGSNQVYTQASASATLDATWIYVQKMNDNNQSSSNEQQATVNPDETTFDGDYTYKWNDVSYDGYNETSNGWYDELNPTSKAYLRKDGTKTEICGVFTGGTVCIESAFNGRQDEFGTKPYQIESLTGYTANKVAEMQSKGAACYSPTNSYYIYCSASGNEDFGPGCSMSDDGYVQCFSRNDHEESKFCTLSKYGMGSC